MIHVRNFFFENNLACFSFFHMPIFFLCLFHVHMHENKKFVVKLIFHSKLIRFWILIRVFFLFTAYSHVVHITPFVVQTWDVCP
jgi:hypothetical protein